MANMTTVTSPTESHTSNTLVVYGTPACPMVYPLRSALDSTKVPYDYINIWEDEHARQRVREINDGNETVPTLVFPDGSTLTEPSTGDLDAKLKGMGYSLGLMGFIRGNFIWIVTGSVIFFGILRFLELI